MKTREIETTPKTQLTDSGKEIEGLDRPEQPQVMFAQFSTPWGQSNPPPDISPSPQLHAGMLRRVKASGSSYMHQAMMQLQRQHGNHFVHHVIQLSGKNEGEFGASSNLEGVIQIEQFSQGADIGTIGAFLNRTPISTPRAQRKCTECEEEIERKPEGEEGEAAQRKSENVDGDETVDGNVETAIEGARGGGQALDGNAREQMEPAFGVDFKDVRVHTDTRADTLNRAVNARAFTTGKDIFFKQGEYSPGSSSGRELLVHELTHVMQQFGDVLNSESDFRKSTEESQFDFEQRLSGPHRKAITLGSFPDPQVTTPPRCIQRSISSEHQSLGDVTGEVIPENTFFEGSPELTYGEIVALSGDFYGSFENLKSPYYIARDSRELRTGVSALDDMSRRSKIEELNRLKRLFRVENQLIGEHRREAEQRGESPHGFYPEGLDTGYVTDPMTGQEIPSFEIATGGRYGELALQNFKHFSFGGENIGAWKEGHRQALSEAFTAGFRADVRGRMLAIARNAASAHYLTDAFSSGHMRVPRRCADEYYRALLEGMVDPLLNAFVGALPADISLTVPLSVIEDILPDWVPVDNIPDVNISVSLPFRDWARELVNPLSDELRPVMNEPIGQAVGGLVSKWLHDKENERGLWVSNRAGGLWKAFGDAFLDATDSGSRGNTTNRAEAAKAVKVDLEEVNELFEAGKGVVPEASPSMQPTSSVVFFGFDQPRTGDDLSVIDPAARQDLGGLADQMNSVEGVVIRLEGWADSRGDEDYNMKLSYRRISVVRGYLMEQGLPGERIASEQAYGEPLAPTTAANHRQYRRVNVTLEGTPRRPTSEDSLRGEDTRNLQPPEEINGPYAAEEYLPEVLEENPPLDPYEWCDIADESLKSEVSGLAREMVRGLLRGKATTLIYEKLDKYGPYEIEIPIPLLDPIRVELPEIPLRRWATGLVGPAIEDAVDHIVTDDVFTGLLDGAGNLAGATTEVESAALCDDRTRGG